MDTNEIYSLRNSFSIIGLTGKTGSGCTLFSKILTKEFNTLNSKMLRKPENIKYIKDLDDNNVVFKRKYQICYDFYQKENDNYKAISYISVILFYILHYVIVKESCRTKNELVDKLYKLVCDNFKESKDIICKEYKAIEISKQEICDLSDNYETIIEKISDILPDFKNIKNYDDFKNLYNSYFEKQFTEFSNNFYKLLGGADYYFGSLFVHRIGNKIRATGNPFETIDDKKNVSPKNVYNLVYVINKLIKAWRTKNEQSHICIDSLRNSLEVMFLKERYSGFYMVAIHNNYRHKERIRDRVLALRKLSKKENLNDTDIIVNLITKLDEIEGEISDFKKGNFYAPDLENCIQKSEIHINNPGKDFDINNNRLRDTSFYTMSEQWIRIKSLMSHPGIVTPTHEERCMQIAYNSKFNSGCISRQVGAVITDKHNSIRSVGWNDVPKGSSPCNIRTLSDILNQEVVNCEYDKSYSRFEFDSSEKPYKYGGNFSSNTKELFKEHVVLTKKLGLNHSFCFKSLHNKFELKDNQVHTRSLHAEENAMLQISKFGGQPLMGGTLYTTASPCELCAKKAYQLGIENIVYIDPYPGISMEHVLDNGYCAPKTKMFTGIIGRTYNKLFEPFLAYKDELSLLTSEIDISNKLFENSIREFIRTNLKIELPEKVNIEILKKKLEELK